MWLVALTAVVAIVGTILVTRPRPAAELTTQAQKATEGAGVIVTTTLGLGQTGQVLDLIATVKIFNSNANAVVYLGIACGDPVTVEFRSTRPVPFGPTYSASASALRTKVMDFQRTLDQALSFSDLPAGQGGAVTTACDASRLPSLPAHSTLTYRLSSPLVVGGQPWLDSPTTDVVTTLQLGRLADTAAGQPPSPLIPTDLIEVRTPLRQLTSYTVASKAAFDTTAARFDLLMKNAAVAAWIDGQDPSSWRDSRLTNSFNPSWDWTLTAFSHDWAVPLIVKGSTAAVINAGIPEERASRPPVTAATIPGGAIAANPAWTLSQDVYAGDLVLPSGKVMVGDPVASDGMLAFDLGLRPGRYPVHVVTARPKYLGDDWARVAWETLTLSSSTVTHWEPAVPTGHSVNELNAGQVFSWGTDGGTGGFASPEAMTPMDASLQADQSLYSLLGDREEATGWVWALLTVDQRTGANVFACPSGFGDGGYPVLLGLDAGNRPAMLVSDFGVLEMSYSGIHAQ